MRGVGTAWGAVTLVNALPTGVGCAAAISLPVRSEIELRPTPGLGAHRLRIEPSSQSALIHETLAVGLARFAPGGTFSAELKIESQVPVGKGLKSSSAVAGAVLRAIASAVRISRPPEELARLAADIAQEIGLSATGAYDDCLAAIRGGVAFTDNPTRSMLRAPPLDLDLRAVIWIPPETHAPSSQWHDRFRAEINPGKKVVEAAHAGRWAEAMKLNSELVERVMGYTGYGPLRYELQELGAAMCGVSGMGPALAALVPRAHVTAVLEGLADRPGQVIQATLRPEEGASRGGS